MSSITTITEMRSMSLDDLRKEVRAHQTHVQKMRLQITMGTEKDTGKYRREKKQLARMLMVMGDKLTEAEDAKESKDAKDAKDHLKQKPKTATVAAPKKPRKTSTKRSS